MPSYTQSATYQRCQSIFDRRYPNFRNAGEQYADLVAQAIAGRGSEVMLLDVGCGRDSLAAAAVRQVLTAIGIDLSFEDLRHNSLMTHCAGANSERLPFPDNRFDVLISQWVVEHFSEPNRAFAEMARVLRPGGRLVLLTTNANNYIPLIGRVVSGRARDFVINRILRRPSHESFPTFYRANTRRALEKIGDRIGLHMVESRFVGNPFYLAFSTLTFRGAMLYEQLTDSRSLQHLKLYLLATLEKPAKSG